MYCSSIKSNTSRSISTSSLYLSNLDDIIGARVFTPSVYFYRSNNNQPDNRESLILKWLQDALSEVLVPYYPLSGRLREVGNEKLKVFFGEQQVPNPAWLPLIYRDPEEEAYKVFDMPSLIVQFLASWAATAKTGKLITDPEPVWDREAFKPRNPPMVKYPHHEYLPIEERSNLTNSLWEMKPLQKCYRISKEFQCWVKSIAQRQDSSLVCTTFDSMAAHILKTWVKSLDVKLRLTFSVNVRTRLNTLKLRKGFYGNVLCLACAMSSVDSLINDSLSKTTRLVQEARLEDYLRSTVDYVEVKRPKKLEFGGKLMITQWTRFEMYETADFGWGKPVYAENR